MVEDAVVAPSEPGHLEPHGPPPSDLDQFKTMAARILDFQERQIEFQMRELESNERIRLAELSSQERAHERFLTYSSAQNDTRRNLGYAGICAVVIVLGIAIRFEAAPEVGTAITLRPLMEAMELPALSDDWAGAVAGHPGLALETDVRPAGA